MEYLDKIYHYDHNWQCKLKFKELEAIIYPLNTPPQSMMLVVIITHANAFDSPTTPWGTNRCNSQYVRWWPTGSGGREFGGPGSRIFINQLLSQECLEWLLISSRISHIDLTGARLMLWIAKRDVYRNNTLILLTRANTL